MGTNAGRLDVLTRQTPARRPAAGASASELTWDQMLHRAQVLANSGMVRTAYAKKPEAIMYAGAKGAELGWSLVASLDFIDPIEGRAEVNAQGRLALIRQAGHEAEVVEEQCDETRAVVRGRRRGTDEWHYVSWTIEEADRAGLTAEWVEKWQETQSGKKYPVKVPLKREGGTYVPAKFGQTVLPDWAKKAIAEGQVKRNDGWWNYPSDKLVARAASRLCRRHFSEVLIGRGLGLHTAEEQGYETTSDLDETAAEGVIVARVVEDQDDVVDGEIVEPEQGEDPGLTAPATEIADDADCHDLAARIEALDDEHREMFKSHRIDAGLPPAGHPDFNKSHVAAAAGALRLIEEQAAKTYERRRKHANAKMGEVGIKGDDARHEFVRLATSGATESTKRLTQAEVDAIVAMCAEEQGAAAS